MALQPSGLLYPPLLYFTISRRTFPPPNVQARSVFRLSCPLRFPKLCLRFHNWFPFRCWVVNFNPLCKGPFFFPLLVLITSFTGVEPDLVVQGSPTWKWESKFGRRGYPVMLAGNRGVYCAYTAPLEPQFILQYIYNVCTNEAKYLSCIWYNILYCNPRSSLQV